MKHTLQHSRLSTAYSAVIGLLLLLAASNAWSLDNQWYIGIGGGVSILEPNPDTPGLNVENNQGTLGTLTLGRDLDERSSAQLQLYALGESELTDGEKIPYSAFDATVAYRFFDTRDRRLRRGTVGTALYGRFGLGYANRDTDVSLGNNQNIYFGLGAGAEFFFTRNLAVRAEAFYHDQDILSAQLALVTRFGGRRANTRRPPKLPVPEVAGPSLPAPQLPSPGVVADTDATPAVPVEAPPTEPLVAQTSPEPVPSANDTDGDGIENGLDACPASATGYPVREDGCPLFDGVLSGIQFIDRTSELAANVTTELDNLANLLKRYPAARIELLAHTDSRGDVRSQSILTRARLRAVGTYLVSQGVRANRLILRSFGGTRPLYDNANARGRRGNNRIEVIEHLPAQ